MKGKHKPWSKKDWKWLVGTVIAAAAALSGYVIFFKPEPPQEPPKPSRSTIVEGDSKAVAGGGAAVVAPGADNVNVTVTHTGIPPETFEKVVKDKVLAEHERDAALSQIEKFLGDKSQAEQLLSEFEKIPELAGVDRSKQPEKVREILESYKKLSEDLASRELKEPDVVALRKKGKEALDKGDFVLAGTCLENAAEKEADAAREAKEQTDELFTSAASAFAEVAGLKQMQLAYADAAVLYEKAADLVPGTPDQTRAEYLNSAGSAWWHARRYGEAERAFVEALGIRRSVLAPQDPAIAESLHGLGTVLSDERKFADAKRHLEEALSIRRQLAETEPHLYLPDVAGTLNNLGNVLSGERNFPEARKSFEEALDTCRKLAQAEPNIYLPDVAMTLNNLGNVLSDECEFPEAAKSYEEALLTPP